MHSQYLARKILRREMMLEELTRHSVRRPRKGQRSVLTSLRKLLARAQRSRVAT